MAPSLPPHTSSSFHLAISPASAAPCTPSWLPQALCTVSHALPGRVQGSPFPYILPHLLQLETELHGAGLCLSHWHLSRVLSTFSYGSCKAPSPACLLPPSLLPSRFHSTCCHPGSAMNNYTWLFISYTLMWSLRKSQQVFNKEIGKKAGRSACCAQTFLHCS